MLKNYLLVAIRKFRRNKVYSFINIASLTLAFTTAFVIFPYVYYHHNFDKFHDRYEDIYRLGRFASWTEDDQYSAYNFGTFPILLIEKFKEELPEVEAASLVVKGTDMAGIGPREGRVTADKVNFYREGEIIFAHQDFLNIFSLDMIMGSSDKVLNDPKSMLISQSTSEKYFKDGNPIDETIYLEDIPFIVRGVFEDVPSNSSLTFDMVFSIEYVKIRRPDLSTLWSIGFMKLHSDVDKETFLTKFKTYSIKAFDDLFQMPAESTLYSEAIAQPISQFHYEFIDEEYMGGRFDKINSNWLNTLTGIGIFVLLIGWINYTNLLTANSIKRVKEIGIRKVVGGSKHHILTQYSLESILFNMLSCTFAFTLVQLLLPLLPMINFDFDNAFLSGQLLFWVVALMIIILGAIVSSAYPAYLIISNSYLVKLKTNYATKAGGQTLRNSLITFQFGCAIGLIISAVLVYSQLDHILNYNLGYNREQVYVIRVNRNADTDILQYKGSKLELLNTEIGRLSGVSDVTISVSVPTNSNQDYVMMEDLADSSHNTYDIVIGSGGVDPNFVEFYGIDVVAGRNFDGSISDDRAMMLSENSLKMMNIDHPDSILGKPIRLASVTINEKADSYREATVIGIFKDYLLFSLYDLRNDYRQILTQGSHLTGIVQQSLSIKLTSQQYVNTLDEIRKIYNKIYPEYPMDAYFLEDSYQGQYEEEFTFRNMISAFTLVALLISCLGLYGLISILINQKVKEIGIRKVLGASITHLSTTYSVQFLRLILIAGLFSIPLAHYFISDWLDNFAVRIEMSWYYFVLPLLAILVVALFTLMTKTVSAALENPVNALRDE